MRRADRAGERQARRPGDPDGGPQPIVELRGVAKSYREGRTERVVLAGVDALVGRGEFVALLGPSGSGKSTVLNLIGGVDVASEGDVIVEGRTLGRLGERARALYRRRAVGFVFQFFNLIQTLTVDENVRLPLELNGVDARETRSRVAAVLEMVGLGDRGTSLPGELSGGEQQRVAVARAIVHRPVVVLADEPTGNLDAESARHVVQLLRDLARDSGTTVVMATHSAEGAAAADRVLVLRDRRLVGECAGSPPRDR